MIFKMRKGRIILIAAFVLVLSAGMVVGRLWARLPMRAPGGPPPSWLADQLNLNSEQRQKMDSIWAETREKLDKAAEHRHELDHEREQAVLALLTNEQQKAYEQIIADFHERHTELDEQRQKWVADADQRSLALLTDAQLKKWNELRDSHDWHGGPHGPDWHRGGPAGGWPAGQSAQSISTTQPTAGIGAGGN